MVGGDCCFSDYFDTINISEEGKRMKRMFMVFLAVAASIVFLTSTGFAAGFRLPEQDSAAMGMASAFVGQADNPSAVWYNPAGITQLDGTRMSGGVIGIYPVLTHENNTVNPGTTDVSERELHLTPHLYATHKMNDSIFFGFGINSPFGLATDWDPKSSATRYVATYSKVITSEFNPNVAFKLNDDLSLAAGVAYVHLRATLEKTANLGGPPAVADRNFRLSGDGDGWGFNAAVMYKITQSVNAGLSYRSRVKIDVDGDAELTGGATPISGSGSTSITLPDLVQFGVSYKASDNLTLNADLEYTVWSTYDKIQVTSNIPLFNATDQKKWENVWCLRIGGQYKLSDQWKVRAGYLYDQNPVKEEYFETRTPDSDRQGVTIGVGYAIGNITVDAAYLYLKFNKRTVNNSLADDDANPFTPANSLNGTYKSTAQLAGVTIGYKF
jgi:long-chain fatty acid transport protein